MSKPRKKNRFEYTVTVEGEAIIPFSTTVNQIADNAEEAAKLARKKIATQNLDQLNPKVTTGKALVAWTRTEDVARYGK